MHHSLCEDCGICLPWVFLGRCEHLHCSQLHQEFIPPVQTFLVPWFMYLSPGPRCKGRLPRLSLILLRKLYALFAGRPPLCVWRPPLLLFAGTCSLCRWSRTWLKAGWRVMRTALPSWSRTLYNVSSFDLLQEVCGEYTAICLVCGVGGGERHLKTMFSSYVALAQKPEDGKQHS